MIQLTFRDSKPICEQVKDAIKQLITLNVIKADEKLPTVRELAAKYTINPHTIERAYRELADEGYLYMQRDTQIYAVSGEKSVKLRTDELMQEFDDVVIELIFLSVPLDKLKKRLDTIVERENI